MIKLESYLEKPIVKFILWFLTGLFIIFYGTLNVNAATAEHWGYDITHFTNGFFFDCSRNGYCPTSLTTENFWGTDANGNHMYPGFASLDATTVADSAGIMFAFAPNVAMKPGSIYSSRLYICNATSNYRAVNVNFTTGTSSTNVSTFATPLAQNYYNGFFSVTKEPYTDFAATNITNISLKNCVALTFIFEPSVNSSVVGYQFTTSSTITADWVAVGYDFQYIGDVSQLSYSQVKNIIETSTLQTSVGIEEVKQDIAEVDEGINEVKQELSNVNESINETNDIITNDNVEGVDSAFEGFDSFLEDNGTITQLITLPITLYSAILNNINGTCRPFNLGNLFGANLTLPCINLGSYLGNTLWTMIDIIISGFAVYFIAKKLVKVFNNVSSMKEGDVIDD